MTSVSLSNAPLQVLDDPLEQARFTTWHDTPAGEREATSQFRLSGLHCGACAGLIEAALRFAITTPHMATAMVGLGSLAELDHAIAAANKGPLPADALTLVGL